MSGIKSLIGYPYSKAALIIIHQHYRSAIIEKAKENIKAAQEKQREDYNRKRANPAVYRVGSKVLVKDILRRKRKGGKMDHRWLGPYLILKNLGKGTYLLQNEGNKTESKVNGAHIKPFYEVSSTTSERLMHKSQYIHSSKEPTPDSGIGESNHYSNGEVESNHSSKEPTPDYDMTESEVIRFTHMTFRCGLFVGVITFPHIIVRCGLFVGVITVAHIVVRCGLFVGVITVAHIVVRCGLFVGVITVAIS